MSGLGAPRDAGRPPAPPRPALLRRVRTAAWSGAGAALAAGAGSMAWSWVAGPAPVFRPGGTPRWDRLLETGWSWAVLVFVGVAATVLLVGLAREALRRR